MRFLTNGEIARICHAANRELRMVLGQPDTGGLADDPNRATRVASGVQWFRWTGGKTLPTEKDVHDHWVEEMKASGARPEDHPCMRPWSELPNADRIKDGLFAAMVRHLMGWKIEDGKGDDANDR